MTTATQAALSSVSPLPDFDSISTEEIEPSLKSIIARVSDELEEFEISVEPSWEATIGRLYQIMAPLNYAWGIVNFLKSAKDNESLRKAHKAVQSEIVAINTKISQSRPLYEALTKLKESSWNELSNVQRRLVDARIREAELGGVALEGEKLERFKQIRKELAELGTKFSDNVLDTTKLFGFVLTDPDQVRGIPAPILTLMAKNAASDDGRSEFDAERGPWKVTLDGPVAVAIISNADDRSLREKVYRAWFSQASSGDFDNRPLVLRILRLRKEQAALLGFGNFAEMNFHRKMADSAERVWEFLEELRKASVEGGKEHVTKLTEFARKVTGDDAYVLQAWDQRYWNEKLREELFGFNAEMLRRYFPYEQVVQGLFEFCRKMFGVRFEPADGAAPVWDPSVRLFKVLDEDGSPRAHLYLDAFARPEEKLAGAWANSFVGRHREENGEVRLPSAWLICNQLPPVGDTPSLMTFVDVRTLFHEVGHTLHTMLTEVDFEWAAGNSNIEWDAVEIPSTFMENWCYDKETLMAFARDYETGEQMPEEVFDKIVKARTFGSAFLMNNYLYYTELDLELHDRFDPDSGESLEELDDRVTKRNLVIPPPDDNQFLCVFEHIFNGGYAAGYYTYLWSEMLSTDIYYAFVEAGRENAYQVGKRFRETFLTLGGGHHPSEIFREFRGRDPETWPLLDHLGLVSRTTEVPTPEGAI